MKLSPTAQVTLATVAFLLSQGNLAHLLLPLQPSVFSLQLAFAPTTFWQVIHAWGEAGVAVYRSHFGFDMVHPLIYGLFGYLVVSRTRLFPVMASQARRFFQLALPVAGSFDLLENLSHLYLFSMPEGKSDWLIPFAATCSGIKWGLALLFALGLALRLTQALGKRCFR